MFAVWLQERVVEEKEERGDIGLDNGAVWLPETPVQCTWNYVIRVARYGLLFNCLVICNCCCSIYTLGV